MQITFGKLPEREPTFCANLYDRGNGDYFIDYGMMGTEMSSPRGALVGSSDFVSPSALERWIDDQVSRIEREGGTVQLKTNPGSSIYLAFRELAGTTMETN